MKLSIAAAERRSFVSLAIAISLGMSLSTLFSWQAKAETVVRFQPPEGNAPGGTRGGASRGDTVCIQNSSRQNQLLRALIPPGSNYGLTLAERPQVFAYIPTTTARQAWFVLKDDRGNTLHQHMIPIAGHGRVIPINITEHLPALEVGKTYEWGIALLCAGRLEINSPFTSAWVQRIAPPTEVLPYMEQPPSLQKVAALGAHGIWYDMLSTLTQLQPSRQEPANISIWSQLLQSVGLGDVSTVPIERTYK